MKKRFVVLFIFVAVSLVAAPAQDEGRCLQLNSPKDELARSDAVFVGSVLEISEYKSEKIYGRKKTVDVGVLYKVRMRVEKSWKGVKTKETSFLIYSGSHSSVLFTSMKEGEKFLVYAVSWKALDELIVGGCMRTRKIQDAREDLSQLGKSKKIK
jgi:hypothetical protein